LAISTRGAIDSVRNTPTGLPDWTRKVSRSASSACRLAKTILSKCYPMSALSPSAMPHRHQIVRVFGRPSGAKLFISRCAHRASVSQLFGIIFLSCRGIDVLSCCGGGRYDLASQLTCCALDRSREPRQECMRTRPAFTSSYSKGRVTLRGPMTRRSERAQPPFWMVMHACPMDRTILTCRPAATEPTIDESWIITRLWHAFGYSTLKSRSQVAPIIRADIETPRKGPFRKKVIGACESGHRIDNRTGPRRRLTIEFAFPAQVPCAAAAACKARASL